MGFFSYITNLFRSGEAKSKVAAPIRHYNPRGGMTSMIEFSTDRALCVAAAHRCIRLLRESVAQLPLMYMRLKDGIFVPDTNSRLHTLLTVEPDACFSAFDCIDQTVGHIITEGNAYIVPIYAPNSLELMRLALCTPGTVQHNTDNDTYEVHDSLIGIDGTFRENEIIHIKNHCLPTQPKVGLSTLSYARQTLAIASQGESETYERFRTGGSVRGLVGNGHAGVTGYGEYQDNEMSKAAEDLDTRFNVNGERIVSVPGDVSFKPITLSSVDMQFLESRKFTVRDICRFFGVHPSFVFDDTSNNYKSAEMANVAFLSNTLNPLLRKIETEFLRKLVAPSLWGKRRIQFDRRELYACDLSGRVDYQTKTIANGTATINEWRLAENRPAVEGGDTVLVSANLKSLTELRTQGTTNNESTTETPNDNDTESTQA